MLFIVFSVYVLCLEIEKSFCFFRGFFFFNFLCCLLFFSIYVLCLEIEKSFIFQFLMLFLFSLFRSREVGFFQFLC